MKQIILVISLITTSAIVVAQNNNNVVTTAVPYLRISADARAGGMGDAGVATQADANSIYWNSAKTLFADKKAAIGLNYTAWFREVGAKDIYLLTAGGYKQLNDKESITGGIRYFSQGTIQFTSINGDLLSVYKPRDFDVSFGYNRKLNSKLGVGVTMRLINSNLSAGNNAGSKTSTSIAADLSLLYNGLDSKGAGWRYGVNISNLGSKMGFSNSATTSKDYIPANLAIGASYTKVLDEKNSLSFTMDINKLLVPIFPQTTGTVSADSVAMIKYRSSSVVSSWFNSFSDGGGFFESLSYSIGAEYKYDHLLSARLGYYSENHNRGNRKFFTTGVGVNYKKTGLYFSYLIPTANSDRNILTNTMRLGLVFE